MHTLNPVRLLRWLLAPIILISVLLGGWVENRYTDFSAPPAPFVVRHAPDGGRWPMEPGFWPVAGKP